MVAEMLPAIEAGPQVNITSPLVTVTVQLVHVFQVRLRVVMATSAWKRTQ